MSIPTYFPMATPKMDGRAEGAWSGRGAWKICLHTTETVGVPGYSTGALAPHLTYDTATRAWTQHYPMTRPAESVRIHDNDQLFQIEVVCYSARSVAAQAPTRRLWVGDLTDGHLSDLAAGIDWIRGYVPIAAVWPGRAALTYAEANTPGFRFTTAAFLEYSGILGHQHVPDNTHWDPGAFPWTRLTRNLLTKGDTPMTTPEFVARLLPEDIRALCQAKGPGGRWVISPDSGDRAGITTYYTGILGDINNRDWIGFHHEVEVAASVNGAIGGSGGSGLVSMRIAGTVEAVGTPA